MKKNNYFEMIGVLSLSLILTSAYSVSSCLPEMLEYFDGYGRASVELLLSVPSFAMVVMIALSSVISRFIPERVMIGTGLALFGTAGIVPVFVQSYPVMFAARLCLGIGTGLINAKAITIIGERYSGALQQKLQGIRCSMETLGQATLTLIAGQLLVFGWNYSFFIYAIAFLILFMYLAFVPARKPAEHNPGKDDGIWKENRNDSVTENVSVKTWLSIVKYAALGFLMISTNVANSLRVPTYVVEKGIGTAAQGSLILSCSVFSGFISGLFYGFLAEKLKKAVLPVALACASVGLFTMYMADSLIVMGIGACICGAFVTICISYMFSRLPEALPIGVLNTGNSIVLVGCNLGSSTAPFVLGAIGTMNSALNAGFLTYALVYVGLAVFVVIKNMLKNKK
ncbi:MAG: MFS transporter [Lachnospiraceae bacterium]|nr:MFS transporter [Lachnospiraceae bacterium]